MFILNDLSVHAQFKSPSEFYAALQPVLQARQSITKAQYALRIAKGFLDRSISPHTTVRQAISAWPDRNMRQVVMLWLTKHGPHWDDDAQHFGDEYHCEGRSVSGSGIAEAAAWQILGEARELVSMAPSQWLRSPIAVDSQSQRFEIVNHWTSDTITKRLVALERPVESWKAMLVKARATFPDLLFAERAIDKLLPLPFHPGASERLLILLDVLQRIRTSFDGHNRIGAVGKELQDNHFGGDKQWFTDESEQNKAFYKEDMTFWHPTSGQKIFCPWHGKVKWPQLRIHFETPIRGDRPVFVGYIGPKITV